MSATALPTTYPAPTAKGTSAKASPSGAPVRRERFTSKSVANVDELASQLTRMHRALEDQARTSSANPTAGAIFFEGVAMTAGTELLVQHNLGRRARWSVVGWRDAAGGASIVDVTAAADAPHALKLHPYVTGTADLMVF